jgi:alpha-ketoglutarate-dependent taurine dioxygenase
MNTAQDFTVSALGSSFGALITDIDLTSLDAPTFARLYDTWLEYALLIFPEQHLGPEDQIRFARRFGELEFDIAPLSNLRDDGRLRPDDDSDDMVKILRGNMGWHADSAYMPLQAKGAVFSAQVVPSSGGETEWADMRAAYASLDDALRERIAPLAADRPPRLRYSGHDRRSLRSPARRAA